MDNMWMKMREEFWDTAPHYGERQEIWDALHAAAEADLTLAQAIVDSAGVIVQRADLTVCMMKEGLYPSILPVPRSLLAHRKLEIFSVSVVLSII
ncbi:uncharacterized protein LOC115693038 [Syzygium oleosum]|uniref:uncharacterized protein LOC115693038 n=1 Tax=Syzygium oleosum TaxID=219896 RepID=UPI0024BBE468|nr:uncharacterized protein LOC115693038 [Syzygium oleosum]